MNNKFFKRLIILISVLTVAASFLLVVSNIGPDKLSAYFSTFNFDTEFGDIKPLSLKHFETLNDNEKKAYIAVFNNIKKHPEYIKIPELTNEEFNNVFFAVKNDNPDILCFSESCNMISFHSSALLQLNYSYSTELCNSMTAEMNKIADDFIADIQDKSLYEKELIIHDRLIEHCSYSETFNSSNAYGCLVEKEAVCSGYSRAAMLLFKKAGIESMVVAGTGVTPDEGEISHMWNVVWLDNSPYHIDVTWDDPVSDSDYVLSHLYFNLTDEQISKDHKNYMYSFYANNKEYNYFVQNGTEYNIYNKSTLEDICKKLLHNINSSRNYIEIVFTTDESYNAAVNSLINNSDFDSDMYTIVNYISDNNNGNIDVSHVNFSKDDTGRYIRIFFDSM